METANANTNMNELVTYTSGDGLLALSVPIDDDTVWATQKQIAKLFDVDQSRVARHLQDAIADSEITTQSIYAFSACISLDTKRRGRPVTHYNLDAILSVGYRVRSRRGTEFRVWATAQLKARLLRRGSDDATIARLEARVADLARMLEHLQRAGVGAAIHPLEFDRFRRELRDVATLEVAAGDWNAPKRPRLGRKPKLPIERAIAGVRNALADAVEWGRQGEPWAHFPAVRTQELFAVLRARERNPLPAPTDRKLRSVWGANRLPDGPRVQAKNTRSRPRATIRRSGPARSRTAKVESYSPTAWAAPRRNPSTRRPAAHRPAREQARLPGGTVGAHGRSRLPHAALRRGALGNERRCGQGKSYVAHLSQLIACAAVDGRCGGGGAASAADFSA